MLDYDAVKRKLGLLSEKMKTRKYHEWHEMMIAEWLLVGYVR